jgi:hypothetical protein
MRDSALAEARQREADEKAAPCDFRQMDLRRS